MRRATTPCSLVAGAVTAVAALLAAGGCIDFLDPEIGPVTAPVCVNEDSDPETEVSFQLDIVPRIFQRDVLPCHDCHLPQGRTPFGFEVSGLDLTDHSTLLQGGVNSGANIAIPGRPCDSVIVQKTSEGPPFGSRMPLGGPPFLSAEERQLVSDWIAEGARNN